MVKRYSIDRNSLTCVRETPEGDYVLSRDYDAVKCMLVRVRNEREIYGAMLDDIDALIGSSGCR